MDTCPVVQAVSEIYGGNIYEDEECTARVIKIGGNDVVFDDASFYIMSKKMEYARLAVNPSLEILSNRYQLMHKASNYESLYKHIISQVFDKKYLYNQFIRLINLIGDIGELIVTKCNHAARSGHAINVSLPNIDLLPTVDVLIVEDPLILHQTINNIIDFITKINVNSLCKLPGNLHVDKIQPFAAPGLDMSTTIALGNPKTEEEYLGAIKSLVDHEIIVATYVREVESYHINAINTINKIFAKCDELITRLGAF